MAFFSWSGRKGLVPVRFLEGKRQHHATIMSRPKLPRHWLNS
jgi:hypothetical protein